MRPVPIPDDMVPEGCKRYVIGPPDGDLINDEIRPVEAVAGIVDGQVRISMLVMLEPGDLERLAEQKLHLGFAGMWLTMLTNQIPAFSVEIADGKADACRR